MRNEELMIKSVVASNAKRIINERGYKQKAIAQIAGYDIKTFNNLLNGRKFVTDCDIIAISNALGVTPNELFAAVRFGT